MNIFVGNLLFEAREEDVRKLFEKFGSVSSVAIVMDKKGVKSRGFGFVEMPDAGQAQTAIESLDSKEFMRRPLNVSPAHPKSEKSPDKRSRKKIWPKVEAETPQYPVEDKDQKNTGYTPVFRRTGGYKGGRRSLSFQKRQAAAGIDVQVAPPRKQHPNPGRWRKNKGQAKPWQKSPEEPGSSQKRRGESKPWMKDKGGTRPGKKA